MNAPFESVTGRMRSITAAIEAASARIVPSWPLDRLIAVNPYEGHADKPIAEVRRRLDPLCGTSMLMPRAWYREEWRAGRLGRADLVAAVDLWQDEAAAKAQRSGPLPQPPSDALLDSLLAALETAGGGEPLRPSRLPLATALADGPHLPGQPVRWADLVVHQVSQHCAAWFDDGQSAWRPHAGAALYGSWRERIAFDRGLPSNHGRLGIRGCAAALPSDPRVVIAAVADALGIADAELESWCEALLLDVGGWAAACAYRRRHAMPATGPGMPTAADPIVELLGIRAGWEWLLLNDDPSLAERLRAAWRERAHAHAHASSAMDEDRVDWLLQSAIEQAYSRPLCAALAAHADDPQPWFRKTAASVGGQVGDAPSARTPAVQALFCIDVRSEPFRRALEAADPAIRTYGFAGFFGVPVAHVPLGTQVASPRVPGLLSAALCVTQTLGSTVEGAVAADPLLGALRQRRLQGQRRWATLRSAAASTFGFVESIGLSYAGKLLKDSLPSAARQGRWEDNGLRPDEAAKLRLRLAGTAEACAAHGADGGDDVAPAGMDGVELASRILAVLGAIGLQAPLAPLLLIAGHGSQTRNNAHAAGLDCGACGGHTGEVNARLLAGLLNDTQVRAGLAARGTAIPEGTWFIAGLHHTTTDEVTLFEDTALPASHAGAVARLSAQLHAAGDAAREARAPSVSPGLAGAAPSRLLHELRVRGNDWAQTRPEWGLAGNAAFIAAPRARTARLDLKGRAFLHDYHWADDPDLAVLELIMIAPLVVANWINLQYYASTVDPVRYGSGNKLLHNVVGGNIGVFEGNGGDLRIGLPWQSVHDGERFRHVPLRLHALIEAPAAAIDTILSRQPHVRALIEHGWMHLLRLPERGAPQRYLSGTWVAEGPRPMAADQTAS